MRKLFIFLVLAIAISFTIGCQEVDSIYTAPDEVEFDPQTEFDGTLTHEVYVIEKGADPLNDASFYLLGALPEGVYVYYVDIYALGLRGTWFVAIRGVDNYQGEVEYSEYALSYEAADVFGETFGFRNRTTGQKPGNLRVR